MVRKHCSDERLLAWLDGEHNFLSAALTRRHLNSCWECRSRVARLEEAAHRLAVAHSRSRFLPPERVEAARQRFLRKAKCRPGPSESNVWKRVLAYAAASALCLAGAVGIWETSRPKSRMAPPLRSASVAKNLTPRAVPPGVPAAPVSPAPLHPSPLADRMPVSGTGSRISDEVVVWSVMHELGLCRERGVQLHSEGGRLRLTGVISSASTRDRLVARLGEAGLPIRLELLSVDDIAASDQPPTSAQRVTRVDAPGEALLRDWLSTQGLSAPDAAVRTNDIANASVLAADLAWSEAWAIRYLAARFGPVWRELPETARTTVLSMTRDHWGELQTFAARQRRLIGGILPAVRHPSTDLFTATEQWADAAQQLFAPAEPVSAEPRQLMNRIASALAEIESLGGDDAALTALLQSRRLNVARGQ